MRSYLVTFSAACFLAGVEAVKTQAQAKQDMWWLIDEPTPAPTTTKTTTTTTSTNNDMWWLISEPTPAPAPTTTTSTTLVTATNDPVGSDLFDFNNLFFLDDEVSDLSSAAQSALNTQLAPLISEQERLAAQKAAAEEAARLAAAQEAARLAAAQEAARIAAAQEAARLAAAQLAAQQEAARLAAAQEAARLAAAQEAARLAAAQEAARLAAAQEAARLAAEQEAARLAAAAKLAAQQEAARLAAAQEAARLAAAQEAARLAAEQEAARLAAQQAAAAQAAAETEFTDLEALFANFAPEVADAVADVPAPAPAPTTTTTTTKATTTVAPAPAPTTTTTTLAPAPAPAPAPTTTTTTKATTTVAPAPAPTTTTTTVAPAPKPAPAPADELGFTDLEAMMAAMMEELAAEETLVDAIGALTSQVEESSALNFDAIAAAEGAAGAVKQVQQVIMDREGVDGATAEAKATQLVFDAVDEVELDEDMGFSLISAALYDLTEQELAALYAMENEILDEEEAIIEAAATSTDPEILAAAAAAIAALEEELAAIKATEQALLAEMNAEDANKCQTCIDNYVVEIDRMTAKKDAIEALIDDMAVSLSEIDPNTENGAEGKSLLRKMYKLKGIKPKKTEPVLPETADECVEVVAGKVIQLEELYDDVDKATSFRDFFANVYCSAYVNSLVTLADGLSQIFPGGLDGAIEAELERVYGPISDDQVDMIEIAAIEAYMGALESGDFVTNDDILIQEATPLDSALDLCDASVHNEIEGAKQDREDYLNDYNFLNYLRTL